MKKIISLIVILLLVTACSSSIKYETVDANKVADFINDGVTIIDVRSPGEYAEGHIKTAINIPLDVIDTISYDKDIPIVVYCASGIRSKQAAEKLVEMEYTNIYNLDGGILNAGELLGD